MDIKGFLTGLTLSIGICVAVNAAPKLPALYELEATGPFAEPITLKDYNVLVEHIAELERITEGMQKQITILHAKKADK